MSLRFIIGRAGSGKTQRLFDRVVEACRADPFGPLILWIVPKQATFLTQRRLTCESGLPGFTRVQILSFDRLTDEILAGCGGAACRRVGDLGRQMIIGHLLRRSVDQLHFFNSSARQVGLAGALLGMIQDFERSGLAGAELDQFAISLAKARPDDFAASSLAAKLHDVGLIYRAYEAFLGQDRLDPRRRDAFVLRSAAHWRALRGATVLVDGFWEFSHFEQHMLATLAGAARETEIALLLDPASPVVTNPTTAINDLSLFHRTERTYRNLRRVMTDAGVRVETPVLLQSPGRSTVQSLSGIESSFVSNRFEPLSSSNGIERLEAPDRRGEVDAVARRLREFASGGLRWRDMAVLARDVAQYTELIESTFAEHGIPFFVDRRRGAGHHPLIQFVRTVLKVARGGWPHESMMQMLKTGLAGVSNDDADEIENYVLEHRLRGDAWTEPKPWNYARRRREDSADPTATDPAAARLDVLRRGVVTRLLPFVSSTSSGAAGVTRRVSDVYEMLESFNARETLSTWIRSAEDTGKLEESAEHEQVWTSLRELFDQMVDLLGDESLTLDEFAEVLDVGLESLDLSLTPPTIDQVLVGGVERSRLPEVKAVVVIGLNEGEFPLTPRPDPLLPDRDRALLGSAASELAHDTTRVLLDERFLGYVALTRASQTLVLTRSLADGKGRRREPSSLWRAIDQLIPDLPPTMLLPEGSRRPEHIATYSQLITNLLRRAVRPAAESADDATNRRLYDWVARAGGADDARARSLKQLAQSAWRSLAYTNEATLPADVVARLFAPPLELTARQLEDFAACPFKHFASRGLRLVDRANDDVTGADLSVACHEILSQLVRELLKSRADWTNLQSSIDQGSFDRIVAAVGEDIRGQLLLSSSRNRYLLQRVRQTVSQVLSTQEAVAQRAEFRTSHTDVRFGSGQAMPALQLNSPRGNQATLRGKIDRIDSLADRGAFAVLDYRLTGSTLALDAVHHGLTIELLLQAAVVRRSGAFPPDSRPAGAFYTPLLRKIEDISHPSEAPDPSSPQFALRTKARGLFDSTFLPQYDVQLAQGWSSVVSAFIKQDGTLGFPGKSDALDPGQFEAILGWVERRAGELVDQIVAGDISVSPYRLNQVSPCVRCSFQSVCRFESSVNRYRHLSQVDRGAWLGAIGQPAAPVDLEVKTRSVRKKGTDNAR